MGNTDLDRLNESINKLKGTINVLENLKKNMMGKKEWSSKDIYETFIAQNPSLENYIDSYEETPLENAIKINFCALVHFNDESKTLFDRMAANGLYGRLVIFQANDIDDFMYMSLQYYIKQLELKLEYYE